MKIKYVMISLFFATQIFISSCEKDEGEGGTSEIVGKVYVKDYDPSFNFIISEYYAQAEDVYIVYGNDIVHSDRTRTHYDGTFRFQYLQKGSYKIYAYSRDSTFNSPSGYIPIEVEVKISKNYQTVETEEIQILK